MHVKRTRRPRSCLFLQRLTTWVFGTLLAAMVVTSSAEARRVMVDCTADGAIADSPVLPEQFTPSPGGVDMRSGRYMYSHTDLSIGGDKGMSLERIVSPVAPYGGLFYRAFGSLTHNWDIWVDEDRVQVCTANDPRQDDYKVTVYIGGNAQTFRTGYDPSPGDITTGAASDFSRQSGGPYSALYFNYTLNGFGEIVPSQYIFVDTDGRKVTFAPLGGSIGSRGASVQSVTDPDGTNYTFDYDTVGLRRVVSNRGYALILDYSAVGTNGANVITAACVLNLGITPLPAMASGTMCPAGALDSSYSYTSGEATSYIDQGGVSTLLGPNVSKLYLPGASTPYLTNTLSTAAGISTPFVTAQAFADGRTYSYSWNYSRDFWPQIMGGTATDNQSHTFSYLFRDYQYYPDPTWFVTPGPEQITDQLGRTKRYTYSGTFMTDATDPLGNQRHYVYTGYNPTTITYYPKPLSSEASYSEYRQFNCTAPVCAMKPTQTTDANGNATDYHYNATHGGIEWVLKPAPAAGQLRPLHLTNWTTKTAYALDSTLVGPVAVIASEVECQGQTPTGTNAPTCDSSQPKRTTTYEYGANGTPNNLWVRGMAVTAGAETRRTCFGYDSLGRKISETKPNANLATCP